MKLKAFCYLLCALGLHILPTFGQVPAVVIRLSHPTDKTHMILPPDDNRATIGVLTQNVTLQTNNITGIWQRPDNTNTTNNKIEFPPFTANFAGLYRFYRTNQNGSFVLAIQIIISVSGTNFAQISTQGDYAMLSGNNIFNSTTLLVCATNDTSQEIQWTHQSNLDASTTNVSTSTWSNVTGISRLEIVITAHGYYTCTPIPGGTSYRVGIFNPDITLVAQQGGTYVYTKGTDPSDIQFICVSTDTNIALNEVIWNLTPFNQNPINLNSLPNMDSTLICNLGSSSTLEVTLLVQGPPTISLSNTTQGNFSARPQGSNTANIRVLTDNVILQTQLKGRWEAPGNVSIKDKSIAFPYFTVDHAGLYRFYVVGWDSNEVLAIQIYISATGTNFAQVSTPGNYAILSGNNIFYTATSLVCATNDTSQQIQWTHQSNLDANTTIVSTSTWNNATGISTLDIMMTKHGYYTCTPIPGGTSYRVGIFNPDITLVAQPGGTYVYTKGTDPSDIQFLCVSTDTNIALNEVIWDVTPFNQNPINLNSLANMDSTLICNLGSSSTLVVTLLVQGPPTISLSNTTQGTFSERPQGSNTANIRVLTDNVFLQTQLRGRWVAPENVSTTDKSISFPYFTVDHAGLYRFYVAGWDSNEVLAIQIYISATGSNFAEETSPGVYIILLGNNVFFTAKKLVCATNDTSQQVKWFYRRTQDSAPNDSSGFAKWNSTSGLSKLDITESENGYFTCEIQSGSSSYSAAKFEKEITIIATNQISIVYTKSIDPNNIQLLCTTTDSSISLYNIKWNVTTSNNNNENPIILNSLDNNEYILNCNGGTTSSSFNVNLLIQGPPKITLSNTTQGTFSSLQPNSNTAAIRVLTQNVTLQINLIGTWQTPKSSSISDNSISYSIFTADLAGLYTFSVNNWKGIQEMAITITISAAGSNFAEKLSSGDYRLLSGNNIFYINRTLVCVTSDKSQEIQWTYQPTQDATNIARTDAIWDARTGISELSITITEQGYYTCEIVSGGTNYTVAIFNPDITIVAAGLFFSYIKGIDPTNIQLLCDPYDTTVTLGSIRLEYSGSQFNNPLILNEAGSIDGFVDCVFGSQLTFSLIIREPSLKLTYTGYTMQYNTLSPNTTPLTIPLFSTDVRLYINNIISGTWNLPRNISGGRSLEIQIFTLVSTGRYTFNSTQTWDGVAREVFRIDISPTGDALATIDSVGRYEPRANNPFFYTDTALVCLTDYNTEVKWFYRTRSRADKQDITTPTTDVNGISTYNAMISQPGFYICEGMKYGSAYTYTAGVFNSTDTRVAVEGASYFYTIEVDREGSELLCDLMNSSVDLNTVEWFRKDVHTNPLDLNKNIHRIALGAGEIKCFASTLTDVRLTADLTIQARPVIKVDYLENTTSFTLYQSAPIYIPLLINNTVISTNLINGIWRFKYSDANTESGSNTEYKVDLFTANNIGVYRYVFKNFYGGGEILVVTLGGTGSGFGMESGSKITTISNNTIFYQDTLTLVAASNKILLESNDIIWTQQDAINDSDISNISEAIIDTTLSTSKLNLDTLLNGYYTVIVKDNNSTTEQYVVGVFKTENIIDTRGVKSINYTSGVDSEELQILCIPSTHPILANVRWVINGSINFFNPVKLEEIAQKFGETKNTTLMCLDITTNDTVYERIQITIKEPPSIIITYFNENIASVGTPDQNTFDIKIQVFTQNVQFECNKPECRWNTGSTFGSRMQISDETDFTIPYITIQNNIPYNLLTKDSSGVFVHSVSITVIPIGTAFQRLIRNGSREVYQTVTTNSIINLEENTTLVCVTSYVEVTEQDIQWFYQDIDLNQVVAIAGQFNSTTGLSVLIVNKTGYYTCQVPDESKNHSNYTVGIIEISNETMEISLSDLQSSEEVDFVLGQPLTLFFQSINISVQAIRWGIARVGGDDSSFLMEYLNPVDVNRVFNEGGSGAFKFTCFYRQSPITTVGALGLNLRDTASLMLQYGQVMDNFSDETNNNFPEPEDIAIQIVTKDVSISCSLSSCAGLILMNGMVLTELSIESLRIENEGIYALKRSSGAGFEYTTASFNLIVTGYMEQNITSLNTNIINDTSVSIIWELQNQLPDNAMETFNITYNASGGIIMMAGITTDLIYNLTDLISGETYTIYVELSYAYTFKTFKKSVEVTIPEASPPFPILRLIPAFVFVIVAIITVIVVILIICIVRQRRKKGKKFQTLQDDERTTPESTKNRLNQGYAPLSTPLENPIFNPDLTESILEKSKFIESVQSKSEHYQNLQDINDPRLKPIPLDLFKKTMDKLWENEQTLEEEYKSLGGEMLRYECRHAQMDQNRIKNKYKFIYPYDKSRVVLTKLGKDPNSDYINASYIPGLYVTENFVASQGPKENTIQDLWRMVLEKKILNVVMVTNCVEGGKLKCEEYFPLKEGKTVEYGPYKVKNAFTQHSTGHITRTLNITSDRESVQVKHFHFTAWPDHDVPSLFDELLTFIGFVQGNITQSEAPILVHCSAGVGRTGTFITLFNLRSAIQKKQPICVYQLVNEMREHRPHMVQTFRQYKFIYLAVLELLLDKTSIPADEFTSTYRTYLKSDQEGYVSVFFQQFSELNYQCEKSFIFSCSEGKNNEHKNPDHNVLPFDNNRVVIFSPHFKANYINASYHENNLFITTQNPIANTVCDFLQMIYQTEATLVVMLTTAKEKSKISANMSDRKPYWPNKDASLSVPPFQVEIVSSEKSTAVIKQKVTLRNLKDDSEHTFMHVVSTTWNDKCDPTDLQSVVTLLKLILKYRQEYPNKHIIMHCADSITKTGIVFIVYQCIREMQETGAVDLFHTIKRLRRERMNIMPDLSNFLSCFALMNEYCSST